MSDPADLYVRDLIVGDNEKNRIAILYLRTMVDLISIRESVIDALWLGIRPGMQGSREKPCLKGST